MVLEHGDKSVNWSGFKYKNPKIPARDKGDCAGFVVKDRDGGTEVHRETVPTGRMSDDKVADFLVSRREKLEKKYAPSRFDIESGIFNSPASFEHFFPMRSQPQE